MLALQGVTGSRRHRYPGLIGSMAGYPTFCPAAWRDFDESVGLARHRQHSGQIQHCHAIESPYAVSAAEYRPGRGGEAQDVSAYDQQGEVRHVDRVGPFPEVLDGPRFKELRGPSAADREHEYPCCESRQYQDLEPTPEEVGHRQADGQHHDGLYQMRQPSMLQVAARSLMGL